ncbi:MAG: hypothetical protein AAGF94_08035 [Pseudomonadota bacterium]
MKSFLVTTAFAVLMAALAVAQPFQSKGEVEGWNVFYNEATGGCFMEQSQGDAVVHLGTEAAMLGDGDELPFGFVALYTKEPTDVPPGDQVELAIDVDGQAFSGTGVGASSGDYNGGYLVANNPNFATALADGKTMNIAVANGNTVSVDLTGTKAAMDAVRTCQAAASN